MWHSYYAPVSVPEVLDLLARYGEECRIIAGGTLAELKKLFPPAKREYVEKQPTLEEIFLAVVGKREEK
jgi:CO/xanthine dehydrogenase FAD-binding subunit